METGNHGHTKLHGEFYDNMGCMRPYLTVRCTGKGREGKKEGRKERKKERQKGEREVKM